MVKSIKSDFLIEIKKEIKCFTKNETYINSSDQLGFLIYEIFQVAAHTRYGINKNEADDRIRKIIRNSIQHLENMIVDLAIKYEKMIKEHYGDTIDPQKFIDYTQAEAKKLSYELYSREEIKILRNFHIYYLTHVKASNSLINARISKAHDDIKRIFDDQNYRGDPIIDNDDDE